MPHVDIPRPDGAVLRAFASGDGPALLLVSGLGGTAAFWNPVVEALSNRFRLIRFDQRGIAASTRGTAPCTVATLAADAAAVLSDFTSDAAILVGHSTGGCMVQEMALSDPAVASGLVLSGTWARPSRYMTELFRSRRAVLRAAPQEYAALGALTSYTPAWLNRNWSVFDATVAGAPVSPAAQAIVAERIKALLAFDRSADLAGLEVPAAIIGAEDDLIVPSFLQRELGTMLPAAPVVILDGGGHFFPVTRTAEFVAHIVAFADGFAQAAKPHRRAERTHSSVMDHGFVTERLEASRNSE